MGTLPVVALHFQSLSWLSPLANLWAVPWLATLATPLAVLAAALDGSPQRLTLAVADAAVDVGLAGLRLVDIAPGTPAVGVVGALLRAGSALRWRRALSNSGRFHATKQRQGRGRENTEKSGGR